jgi:hypothetical protein
MTVTDGVGINIWVDWNIDGDFDDSGEKVYASGSYKSAGTYTGSFSVPAGASIGSTRMRIRLDWNSTNPAICGSISRGETEDYTFVVTAATPMSYTSSTTTQTVTSPVAPFSTAQQIVVVQVVTSGASSPLSATSFSFNTNGSTAPLTDIICANLYFTGTTNSFSTAFSFGSTVSQPNGNFSFTDSYTLGQGTNYFWLTYDVPLSATIDNILDAECTALTVAGSNYTPTITNPGSGRPIANTYLHNNNTAVSSCSGAYYDDGGLTGTYAQNTSYTKTFIPDAGKYMRIAFSAFSTEATNDPLKIYDGPTTASTLMGTWSGSTSPGTKTATTAGGELTVNFVSDNFVNTYPGWEATISCVSLPPNCANYTSPANGATNQATNSSIVWTAPATDASHNPATSYKLYFGTDAAATNIHNGTDIGNVLSWGTLLNTSTTYYWKIVPVNRSGDAIGCSSIYAFTTAATQTMTNVTVCASGCDFTSIKSAYDASTTATPYVITIKTGYAGETYPIAFNNANAVPSFRNSANTITIRPDAGFTYTYGGAANKVLEFSGGAKHIIIDGRQGGTGTANSFIFQNTSTTLPVINFTGDNSYNTIQYCKIQGRNQSNGIVDLRSPSGSGIRNITLDNNEISPNGGNPTDGIYCEGTAALKNTNIVISNNKIYDIWADVAYASHGIYFGANDFNSACSVSGNSVYFTSSKTPSANHTKWYGIVVTGDNHTISNNYVGGTAASCGGTALTISGTKENQMYGIVLKGSSASSTSVVYGNTVSNIALSTQHRSMDQLTNRTASSGYQSLAGIVIQEGSATVSNNTVGGTSAGNITVINTNTTNPASVNDGTNWGYSTELVGIAYYSKLGTINNSGNAIQGLWCYPSSTATTNLNSRVIGILACTDNSTNSGYTHRITNNTIGGPGGLKSGNATTSDGFIIGIYSGTGRGSIYINNNNVSNLWVNSTGDYGFLRGIHNNAGLLAEIENNQVSNLVCSANNHFGAGGDNRNRSVIGIMCDNDGGFLDHFFVNKNSIYDLRSTAASASVYLIGLYYRHAAAPVYGRVFGNKIYSINASSTDLTSKLVGVWAYGQNTITYNNMVVLGSNISAADGASCPGTPANTGGYELIGLENYYGKNEYYYNSIHITGTSGIGASNSYAYKYTNNVPDALSRVFKNNIFSNVRSSTAGTAKHYAFSVNANDISYTSNYNYFYVSGTNGVLFDHNSTDRTTVAAWTAASGKDANSGGGSATANDPLFVSSNTCDCDLNITNTLSPVVGGGTTSGVPSYILDDYFGSSRGVSNDIGAAVVGGTLPIELLVFTGKVEGNVVLLKWITASEINNDFFTVEHSFDGQNFSPIATVYGAGNSNHTLHYQTLHNNPMQSINYYRLKQTDFNGAYTYSNTIEVSFAQKDFPVQVYPNPFNNRLIVSLDEEESEIEITIFNMLGEVVYQKKSLSGGSIFEIEIGATHADGIYIMQVQNALTCRTFKLIRQSSRKQ